MIEGPPTTIVIALKVGDATLADRLAELVGGVAGLRLAAPGEAADVELVEPGEAIADNGVALTPREFEVLSLLAEGAPNKTIARRLAISVHTVKFHIASLLEKLDADGRTEAVTLAARLGVIKL